MVLLTAHSRSLRAGHGQPPPLAPQMGKIGRHLGRRPGRRRRDSIDSGVRCAPGARGCLPPGPQPGPCSAGKPGPRADGLSRRAPGKGAPAHRRIVERQRPCRRYGPATTTASPRRAAAGVVAVWLSDQATTPGGRPLLRLQGRSLNRPGALSGPVPGADGPRRVHGWAHRTTGLRSNASDAAGVTDPHRAPRPRTGGASGRWLRDGRALPRRSGAGTLREVEGHRDGPCAAGGPARPYGPPGRRLCGLHVLLPHDSANMVQLGRSDGFRSIVQTYQSPISDWRELH